MVTKVPTSPPNVSVDDNLTEARRRGDPNGQANAYTFIWFYEKVKYGGPWDYKTRGSAYQDFGNFNYGATGIAAGIPDFMLLRGAGCAQQRHKPLTAANGTKCWGDYPYGDDPADQTMIEAGIRYAKEQGY